MKSNKIVVTIEREWNYPLPFKINYNNSTIYFSSFRLAVEYCAKHNWSFNYDDMMDL